MKLQYLGDAKDSFKWDYHDFLVDKLQYRILNLAFMMTPDDEGNDGNIPAHRFPARKEIIDFCNKIRKEERIQDPLDNKNLLAELQKVKELPIYTGSEYVVDFHNGGIYFENHNRADYFSEFKSTKEQVLLIDPDNGFEPETILNNKHVAYNDVRQILEQVRDDAVISIFQHHRRVKFCDDFLRIKERLALASITAIYWHSLMFVVLSKSRDVIDEVAKINKDYADVVPVKTIM